MKSERVGKLDDILIEIWNCLGKRGCYG